MARQQRHARHAGHAGAGEAQIRAARRAGAGHGHRHHATPTTAIVANTTSVPTVATTTTSATTTATNTTAQKAPAAPQPLSPMVIHVWSAGASANWNTAADWTNGVPNAAGDTATYNASTAGPPTTTLNINVTIGQITSGSSHQDWTIAVSGGSTLTLDNTGGNTNPFGGTNTNAFVGTTNTKALSIAPAIVIQNTALDIGATSTGNVTVTGGITGTGNLFIADSSTATITISTATINNTGTLTIGKSDASTTQAGAGAINITGGIGTNVTNISNFAAGAVTLGAGAINNTGTITNSGSGNFTISGNIGSTVTNITLSGTGTATQTLGSGTTINNTGTITNNGSTSGTTTISGNIGSNVTGVTENSSTSKLVLSGSNGSFSTGLNVTAGTVQASGANTNVFGTGTVTIGSTGVLDINGTSQSTGLLSGVAGASVTNSVAGAQTLTLNGTGSQNFAGAIGGGANLALTLSGGTQTLSGTNTYTGATKVNGGTLLVNGSTASGSAVTVNSGGTLGGGTTSVSGTVSGIVAVNGTGIINPGPKGTDGTSASVGTLTTGALTLQSTATFHVDAFGTATTGNWDKLVVSGLATLGSSTLQVIIASGLTFTPGTIYELLDATTISGTFAGILDGSLQTFSGYQFIAHYNFGDTGDFELTAVPEPSTWVAGALALTSLVACRAGAMRRRVGQRRRISRPKSQNVVVVSRLRPQSRDYGAPRRTEDRGQMSEVSGRKSEDRKLRTQLPITPTLHNSNA